LGEIFAKMGRDRFGRYREPSCREIWGEYLEAKHRLQSERDPKRFAEDSSGLCSSSTASGTRFREPSERGR